MVSFVSCFSRYSLTIPRWLLTFTKQRSKAGKPHHSKGRNLSLHNEPTAPPVTVNLRCRCACSTMWTRMPVTFRELFLGRDECVIAADRASCDAISRVVIANFEIDLCVHGRR